MSRSTSAKRFKRHHNPYYASGITGGELYHHIQTYLEDKLNYICKDVHQMSDNDVLHLYEKNWKNYKNMCQKLDNVCNYVNRHWVEHELNAGSDIVDINELSQRIWKNNFFKPLFLRTAQACFNLISMHRNTDSFDDNKPIENDLYLYLNKDLIELMCSDVVNAAAIGSFETKFLQLAQDFYLKQNVSSFEPDQIFEYLTPISKYIHNEINLIMSYLPQKMSISKKLTNMVQDILIPQDIFIIIILENLKSIVQNENSQELTRLYKPISQIPKMKNELAKLIETHIYMKGMNAIKYVNEKITNDPQLYIETIIDVHKKYLKFAQDTFDGEQIFITALDKACGKLINNVTTEAGNSSITPSELLLRYCDVLLRKGTKTIAETDFEEKSNKIMIVFNYIEDKDIFERLYRNRLAKRLIGQLSDSDDHEKSMVIQLQHICGFEYTTKLERMLQDVDVSKTLTSDYEKYCENHHITDIVDFSIMVLTSNSWSFSEIPSLVIPVELKSTSNSFIDFYNHDHNGRKLLWLHQHSKGELQTSFTSQKYIFQVSTYQMAVLLLFNKSLTWTAEGLHDETQIKLDTLLQVISSLLKNKILACKNINTYNDFKHTDIQMNYVIHLSNDFKSKKIRLNLNVPLKSIEQKDISVDETINNDRRMVIQATIVRIMKARQILEYALLIQEVIQQLTPRFIPKIPVIKKTIDTLIEKEYLERQSDDKNTLKYLA
ncbi:unnamed protein product [Adineta steineri]|nr:unnamed protein product [Adineta steineri]